MNLYFIPGKPRFSCFLIYKSGAMRRFLLGLVVFVLYLIQAQVDSKQTSKIKYHKSIETVLNQFNAEDKPKWERLFKLAFEQGYTTGHATGYATGHATGHATGFWRGNATGHSEGYALAEGKGFLDSFLCAVHGLKIVLEDAYRCASIKHLPSSSDYEELEIPKDIYAVINNNDEWVRKYYRINQANIPSPSSTPKDYFETILAVKPKNLLRYVAEIQDSFITWYKMLTFKVLRKNLTPGFINDLRSLLIEFKEKNEARYESIDEVHVRFAAHMARSYRMICALHYQLGSYMQSYAQQHREMDFSEILFKFAPTWQMSQEQFEFLNILRQTLPDRMKSLKHIFFEHNGEWVIFPYDHSDGCGRLMINQLPTIPVDMTTFASVFATT